MIGKMPDTGETMFNILKLICIVLLVFVTYGCALLKGPTEPMGINDWVELKGGEKVCGIKLPTDELNKDYCIVISKPSAIVSLEGLNRMGK
jgi:hypothetical protein